MARNSEYYSAWRARGRKSGRSRLGVVCDMTIKTLTVALTVVLLLTLIAPTIHPERGWIFPILGLVAPAIYVVSLLVALFWIVRWKWIFALPLVVLLVIGGVKLPLFFKPELRRHYDAEQTEKGGVSLMTYNVRGFYDDSRAWSFSRVVETVRKQKPDVVCFQEFNHTEAHRRGVDSLMASAAGYRRVHGGGGRYDLAIYTRLPICGAGAMDAQAGVKSMWADVRVEGDTVRIVNNHLHSTSITASDDAYLSQTQFLTDTDAKRRVKGIFRRFVSNSALRGRQADQIFAIRNADIKHLIVVGDFNDTPQSYVYRTISRGLHDAFARRGTGYGVTFRGFRGVLRIDYILYGAGLDCTAYEVLREVRYSDHYPVVARLKIS